MANPPPYPPPAGPPAGAGWGPPPPAAAVRTVSTRGYWIGALVLVAGLVVPFVILLGSVVVTDDPAHYDRVDVPGTRTLQLQGGNYLLYLEAPAALSADGRTTPTVEVRAADGTPLDVQPPDEGDDEFAYDWSGDTGRTLGSFNNGSGGEVTVIVTGEPRPDEHVAVSRDVLNENGAAVVGGLALGTVAFLGGLVLIISTAVRRSKAAASRRDGGTAR